MNPLGAVLIAMIVSAISGAVITLILVAAFA
jgi:hypothetical protein